MNLNLTLVAQAITFAAFIWFTVKFVWPHMLRAIETRQKTIADGLAAAEQGRRSLETSSRQAEDAVSQARLMNLHPTGKLHADERIESLMGDGGVFDCGNSQNCVQICPKEVPLTTSLAEVMRSATVHSLVRWIRR